MTSQRASGANESQRRNRARNNASDAPILRALAASSPMSWSTAISGLRGVEGRLLATKTPLPWRNSSQPSRSSSR